jgi:hypothetical protein
VPERPGLDPTRTALLVANYQAGIVERLTGTDRHAVTAGRAG